MKTTEEIIEKDLWSDFNKNQKKYSTPNLKKSLWQIANTFIPYIALWILMIYSLNISYWITTFLVILAAGFLVRMFIIFHDCGHGSFFKSRKANLFVGSFFGILAFTPYYKWHKLHMQHHATVGNLDKRGLGDVWTMTKKEFESSKKWKKIYYKLYRHPVFMFGIGPVFVFFIQNRFTRKWLTRKEKLNVYFTNVALVVLFVGMSFLVGFWTYLILQIIVMYVAAIAGLWLFYLQHQYEEVTWYRNKEWDFKEVALGGSSYVKFPKVLQWFSGNIGFHHIHHLNSRIPNYNLEKCYNENSVFQEVKPVTFIVSMKSLKLRLWDEKLQKLVSYKNA